MFDKTFSLEAQDGSAGLKIVAGSEGLKTLSTLGPNGSDPIVIDQQTLINVCAPAIIAWRATQKKS